MKSFDHNSQSLMDLSQAFSLALEEDAGLKIEDVLKEEVLKGASPKDREALLRNLLRIEIAHREKALKPVGEADYQRRFPENQATVSAVFAESRVVSQASIDTDAPAPPTVSFVIPADRTLGDYEIERELGKGGMGVVYRARHKERGEVLALKVLPDVDGKSLHRFKREFRSLADISHPNLVGLRTLEAEGNDWFFTMDLVEHARDFRSYVRPSNQLDEARLRQCLSQLVEGVHALHQRLVVHCDLKPSNVLVDSDGRVVILDFGLVSEIERMHQTATANDIAGTPAYMAPETAGGETATFACDWYAVGVMLYEALSGQLPFDGSMFQILSDKRSKDAPTFPEVESIPNDLRSLCMRLLERDPAGRPGYDEIVACIGTSHENVHHTTQGESLLGRETQLTSLRSQYDQVQATQKPLVAFVSGKSGEGKSALVDRFLRDLREKEDITLLAGRCYDRESVPFKALDSLIDALASYLRMLDARKVAILLPDDAAFLARLFPVLLRVEVVAERPVPNFSSLDERQVRKRAFGALKELLRRLSQQTKIMLFCDDLQWGDSDSAQVLVDVLTGSDMPKMMFIGSFRSDEADASPFLTTWKSQFESRQDRVGTTLVEVGPLSLDDCHALVQRRFPGLNQQRWKVLSSDLFEETGGNAFFVNELLDCLQVEDDSLQRFPLSEVLTRKLLSLPAGAAKLMHFVAVSGQSLLLDELIEAAGNSPTAYSTLSAMRNQRLLRSVNETQDRIDTYHDKIRETVLAALSQETRRDYHRKLAEVIETRSKDLDRTKLDQILAGEDVVHPNVERIYDLSFHFTAAGDEAKSGIYAFLAAEQARRQFSPEIAAFQFELAQPTVLGGQLRPQLPRFIEGLADSFYWSAKYEAAAEALQLMDGIEMSTIQKARLLAIASENSFALHRPKLGMKFCLDALELVSVNTPRSTLAGWFYSLRYLVLHLRYRARPTTGDRSPDEVEGLRIKLFSMGLRYSMFQSGGLLFSFLLRGIAESRKFKPTGEVAVFYGIYSDAAAECGLQHHSQLYVEDAIRISKETDDLISIGVSSMYGGASYFAQAQYPQAIATIATANKAFDRVGGSWFRHLGTLHSSQSKMMLGEIRSSLLENWQTLQSSIEQKDLRSNCTAYLQCRASEGRFRLEELEHQIPRVDEDILSTCNLDKAHGIRQLRLKEFDQAIECFERALERPYKAMLPNWHVIAGIPFLIQALRLSADNLETTDPTESSRRRKRAMTLGRRGVWICWFFPTEYSFALREYGEVLADVGKHAKAEKYLRKSCQVSEKYQTPYELAKSKLALAELAVLRGDSECEQQLAAAQAEVFKYHEQITQALAEIESQFDT